jgi:hypothetical protein
MKFRLSLFVAALLAGAKASNVIDLTPDNFDSIVGKGKPGLIELFVQPSLFLPSFINIFQFCTLVVRFHLLHHTKSL